MIAVFCLRVILSLQQVNECVSATTLQARNCEFNSVNGCVIVVASSVNVDAFIVCSVTQLMGPEDYETIPVLNTG